MSTPQFYNIFLKATKMESGICGDGGLIEFSIGEGTILLICVLWKMKKYMSGRQIILKQRP